MTDLKSYSGRWALYSNWQEKIKRAHTRMRPSMSSTGLPRASRSQPSSPLSGAGRALTRRAASSSGLHSSTTTEFSGREVASNAAPHSRSRSSTRPSVWRGEDSPASPSQLPRQIPTPSGSITGARQDPEQIHPPWGHTAVAKNNKPMPRMS